MKRVKQTPCPDHASQPANARPTWETTSQTNIGIDATLFRDRLTIAMDAYYKYTTDMLMYVSLPQARCPSNIVRNEGE